MVAAQAQAEPHRMGGGCAFTVWRLAAGGGWRAKFQSRRRADSPSRAAARAEYVCDETRDARLRVAAFVGDSGSVGRGGIRQRGGGGAVYAATMAARAVARW